MGRSDAPVLPGQGQKPLPERKQLGGASGRGEAGKPPEGQTRNGGEDKRSESASKARQGMLEAEYRAMGFLRGRHPLALWQERVDAVERVAVKDLHGRLGSEAVIVCIPITRKEVLTNGGEDMAFVSLEDETAITEAVLFPGAYRRYASLLGGNSPLIVTGRVEDDLGAISFEIEQIRPLVDRTSPRGAPLPDKVGSILAQDGFGVLPHGVF